MSQPKKDDTMQTTHATSTPPLPTPIRRQELQLVQAEIPVELFERMEKARLAGSDHPVTRKSIIVYGIERWLSEVEKPRKGR